MGRKQNKKRKVNVVRPYTEEEAPLAAVYSGQKYGKQRPTIVRVLRVMGELFMFIFGLSSRPGKDKVIVDRRDFGGKFEPADPNQWLNPIDPTVLEYEEGKKLIKGKLGSVYPGTETARLVQLQIEKEVAIIKEKQKEKKKK